MKAGNINQSTVSELLRKNYIVFCDPWKYRNNVTW